MHVGVAWRSARASRVDLVAWHGHRLAGLGDGVLGLARGGERFRGGHCEDRGLSESRSAAGSWCRPLVSSVAHECGTTARNGDRYGRGAHHPEGRIIAGRRQAANRVYGTAASCGALPLRGVVVSLESMTGWFAGHYPRLLVKGSSSTSDPRLGTGPEEFVESCEGLVELPRPHTRHEGGPFARGEPQRRPARVLAVTHCADVADGSDLYTCSPVAVGVTRLAPKDALGLHDSLPMHRSP